VNEKLVALRLMVGVDVVVDVTVDVVGVSSWVSPGMDEDNFCMPRPLVELPPEMDEPAAAMPDNGDEVEEVVVVVGLERAPASERELVVVVVEVLVGVLVLDVVPVRVVPLLVLVVVELSTVVVGALSNVEVEDVVVSGCTEARGDDFLMSLWDFRIDAESFVESVLEVLRSDSLAFSWPIAINCSPMAWVNENSTISTVSAAIESIARRRDSKCFIQPPNAASSQTSPWCG
jgi:hypothetical protein